MSSNTPIPENSDAGTQSNLSKKSNNWFGRIALALLLSALTFSFYLWWHRREPQDSTEIFQGIRYGCYRLKASDEGSGLVHWVCVDLAEPGIELFITPLEPEAVNAGWQYRLQRPGDVAATERLAVVINGTLFTSDSSWFRMPGDLARSVETVVADHKVSHFWEHTYLMWFDDKLTPCLKPSKPPTEEELTQARWGIGGQAIGLWQGKVRSGISRLPDSRTAVAVNRESKLLFLAVGEWISPRLFLEKLAELGAKDGMLLDGGGSSSLAIGKGAIGIRRGVVVGGWRPVATCFGVRAAQFPFRVSLRRIFNAAHFVRAAAILAIRAVAQHNGPPTRLPQRHSLAALMSTGVQMPDGLTWRNLVK